MSAVLLDTHAFLWFIFDDPRLSETASSRIADPGLRKLIGIGCLWEIAIKSQLGKLRLGMELGPFLDEFVSNRLIDVVPIELPHLIAYDGLPLHHRDPFDRLLIAQATVLEVPVITADPGFKSYDVRLLW